MKRIIAMFCTLVTVLGVWALSPKRVAMAHPAAGMATDCSPDTIWPIGSSSGMSNLVIYGPTNGVYAFSIRGSWGWTCPPPSVSYASSCAPCYTIRLYKDVNYPNGPEAWVDQQKPEAYFQATNQPSGTCNSGGTWNPTFVCNNLARGRYDLRIEFGAGDDRRCYSLIESWQTIIIQ